MYDLSPSKFCYPATIATAAPHALLGPSSPRAMRATLAQHPPSHKIIKSISFRFYFHNTLILLNINAIKSEMRGEMAFVISRSFLETLHWYIYELLIRPRKRIHGIGKPDD